MQGVQIPVAAEAQHGGMPQQLGQQPAAQQQQQQLPQQQTLQQHAHHPHTMDPAAATHSAQGAPETPQQAAGDAQAQPGKGCKLPEEQYPRCRALMEAYQEMSNGQPKTALAVLHEYAARLSLEVGSPLCALLACA